MICTQAIDLFIFCECTFNGHVNIYKHILLQNVTVFALVIIGLINFTLLGI